MGNPIRFTPVLAMIGALAVGSTTLARAQDTSAVRADTSAYRAYGGDTTAPDTGRAAQAPGPADSGAYNYTGPATDTALKAKPGVQTGPTSADSGKTVRPTGTAADTVVCKDGSNASRTGEVCLKHGGIDWAATEAALKARGESPARGADSAAADTALRAKPGVQTGPADTSAAARTDTGSSNR